MTRKAQSFRVTFITVNAAITKIAVIASIAIIALGMRFDEPAIAQPKPAHPDSSAPSPERNMEPDTKQAAEPDATGEMTDIHDIKPLQPLGTNPAIIYYILLSALALALFIGIIIYWNRRRNPAKEDPLPLRPPEDIAFSALDDLANAPSADSRAFIFALSAILRGYIEARYTINAMEMTSEEFLPAIDHLAIDRAGQRDLKALIRSMDPVKFAGGTRDNSQMQHDLDFVRQLVVQTTPIEENV